MLTIKQKKLNFLIVNNGSNYLADIVNRVEKKHHYKIVNYSSGKSLNHTGAEAIILSGGMIHEVDEKLPGGQYYFQTQFEMINQSSAPIFGICLGLQMMVAARGGKINILPELINKNKEIYLTPRGKEIYGLDSFLVHKKHQRVVANPTRHEFDVLAKSDEGVEIAKHCHKPLLGVQFHPEIDTDELSEDRFWQLLASILPVGEEYKAYV